MGTRSITHIRDNDTTLVTLYRQYDGYPSGMGVDLAEQLVGLREIRFGEREIRQSVERSCHKWVTAAEDPAADRQAALQCRPCPVVVAARMLNARQSCQIRGDVEVVIPAHLGAGLEHLAQ